MRNRRPGLLPLKSTRPAFLSAAILAGAVGCRTASGPAPAAPSGVQVTTPAAPADGFVPSADGVVIHYHAETGGDPPLVLVHCWSCDASYWDGQVEAFSERHRVVAIDLAGHGRSGAGRAEWTIAAFGRDVAAVLDHLDLRGAILIGHSMGGPVVVEATGLRPERVAGIVAVDTLHDAEFRPPPGEMDAFLAVMREDFAGATKEFVRGMFPPDAETALVERVAADMAAAPPEVAIPVMREIFAYDLAAGLERVKVPIQAINASRYPTRLDVNRRYAPQFQVTTMPDVGHFPMLEAPERFNALLAQAIAAIAPSRMRP